MTDQDYQKVFRILAASGQIKRYEVPVMSKSAKDTLAILMIGALCGWLFGFLFGVTL